MSWRWLYVRLVRILRGDTPTARLYRDHHRLTPTQAPVKPSMSSQQVHNLLDAWASNGTT